MCIGADPVSHPRFLQNSTIASARERGSGVVRAPGIFHLYR